MSSRFNIEEGWLTLLLTWGLVMIAAATVLNGEFIGGMELFPVIATLAILTGFVLAKSQFSGRSAFIFALVYGLFLVTFLIGRSMPESMSWQERVVDLFQRQFTWLVKAVTQGSSRDGLMFVIQTSAVFWLVGVSAAWYTFRNRRVWRVVLPSGLILISVVYYYTGPKPMIYFLVLFALVALMYVARTHLVAKEETWRTASVAYEGNNVRFTFMRASIFFALIALIIAWGLPSVSASSTVSDTLGDTGVSGVMKVFQDNWTRLFASLRSYGTTTSDPFRDTLSLGGPRTVTDALVMDVYVEDRLPFVYWQAVTYDTYENGGWSISADADRVLLLPDEGPINLPDYKLRQEVTQRIQNFVPNAGTIYGAPEPLQSDRQLFVTQRPVVGGEVILHAIHSRFVLRQGEEYQVTSNYSTADASSLRRASRLYPEWITDTYLQVPEEITPETRELAAEITAGFITPFDKAIAIRNYLRENIAYNDQIEAPPEGVEPIHYILFDHQEAYCNYYASSMIMMLRSEGVPARFVSGYTQGEWGQDSLSYRVRASNAHSWVEVYFPEYGWIPFEPTASIPSGDRPETSGNPGDAFGLESLGDGTDEALGLTADQIELDRLRELTEGVELGDNAPAVAGANSWLLPAVIATFLLLLAIGAGLFFGRANQRVETNVERSYGRLGSWAPWLGVWVQPAHTPYERANKLVAAVPEGKEPIRNLTHQFVRQQFSRDRSAEDNFDPRGEWKTLRLPMIRHTIRYQVYQLTSRFRRGAAEELDAAGQPVDKQKRPSK